MRPAIVLCILAAGLLATLLLNEERERNFDRRYENVQERIRDLAQDIDNQIERDAVPTE